MSKAHAFPPDPLAPWAEFVPNTSSMTADELYALPDDGWQYELVEGRLVRMPPEGFQASKLAMRLGARIALFVEERALGAVTGEAGGYEISLAGQQDTVLAPDVGFIRDDRLPPHLPFNEEKAVPFAPDLAVEVASPHQYRPELAAKARRYLAAGTQLVWVVWPRHRRVDVWRPGDAQPSVSLGMTDTLDGLGVLPGFTYPLADLFH
ncbi:MAG TPA: Uma2 family endonuclease [Chloroflexota bacterium]|nr:Uma2 family endonuclease [Chloroflexota bacterium]